MSEFKNIAIFASGEGTNAINIIKHFKDHQSIRVQFVLCNNPNAKVIPEAKKLGIVVYQITNEQVNDSQFLIETCNWHNINLIVLAGFLRKIPTDFINYFQNQIINLHPSLLPKFGGQGMWGDNVHKAVLTSGETETGITIHYVTENYDEGEIIAQFRTEISPKENLKSLKKKIYNLEMSYLPFTIDTLFF